MRKYGEKPYTKWLVIEAVSQIVELICSITHMALDIGAPLLVYLEHLHHETIESTWFEALGVSLRA